VYGGSLASLASLKPEALYELAAPSTPNEIREEVERRIEAGELAAAAIAYEKLHPEAAVGAGTGGKAGRTKDDLAKLAKSNAADRFTKDAAKATGRSGGVAVPAADPIDDVAGLPQRGTVRRAQP
jgi:hypothetical protein